MVNTRTGAHLRSALANYPPPHDPDTAEDALIWAVSVLVPDLAYAPVAEPYRRLWQPSSKPVATVTASTPPPTRPPRWTASRRWRVDLPVARLQRPGRFRMVKAKMEELRGRFPTGLDYKIVYDTTPFINESISEVFKTLRDAVILVAVVVLLFLQNWSSP